MPEGTTRPPLRSMTVAVLITSSPFPVCQPRQCHSCQDVLLGIITGLGGFRAWDDRGVTEQNSAPMGKWNNKNVDGIARVGLRVPSEPHILTWADVDGL